jgi:hypothetical protein
LNAYFQVYGEELPSEGVVQALLDLILEGISPK